METALKTKVVSDQLGVNPTTVQRWIKFFNIPCKINEQGHYLIEQKEVELLKKIKEQLNNGLTMKEIKMRDEEIQNIQKEDTVTETRMVQSTLVEERLEQLMLHIEQLERKLSVKADEVVEYQVLQHRSELDSLFTIMKGIEDRLTRLEDKFTPVAKQAVGSEEIQLSNINKRKKNGLMRIFSF